MRFYLGWTACNDRNKIEEMMGEWFRTECDEIFNWVEESCATRWTLEHEFVIDDAYTYFPDIFIVFRDLKDAMHYKLRWG